MQSRKLKPRERKRAQQQNKERWLKYQEQLRSELAARYFHGVVSAGGDSFSNTKSLQFDGIDGYVSLSTISLTSAFSISAWVKFSTLSSAESHIINTGTSNSNRIGVYDANDFQVKIAGTNVFISETGGNDFVTNQWQHVLVTRDASNNVNVFRNGSPFGSSTTLSGTLTLDSIFRFNTSQYALSGNL